VLKARIFSQNFIKHFHNSWLYRYIRQNFMMIYQSTSSYWNNFSCITSVSISFVSHWSLSTLAKSNPWPKYACFSRLVQSEVPSTAQKFEFFLPFYDIHKLFVDRETGWLHAAAAGGALSRRCRARLIFQD